MKAPYNNYWHVNCCVQITNIQIQKFDFGIFEWAVELRVPF